MSFEQWFDKIKYAIDRHDADIAYAALRVWNTMAPLVSETWKTEVSSRKESLIFTAFAAMPLDQASLVIEKNLLNFIVSPIDIDEFIHNRFIYLGYGNEEDDRKVLREAVLHNKQEIGGKTVAEWVQTFDRIFPPENREETAVITFFTRVPEISSMSKTEQNLLRRLLQVYDQWFASPLVTIYDTAAVYKKLVELEKAGVKEINPKTFEAQYLSSPSGVRSSGRFESGSLEKTPSQQILSLPLLQVLSKYENLGNQLITNDRIRVKSQQEPVRPSLLYWLKYYRDELGIGQHNSVERGDFLFRSENGRKLSPEERERVNLILKSIEENLPLSIDTESQEIIFPVFQGVLVSPHQPEPLRTATPLVRRVNNDFGSEKSIVPPVVTSKRPTFQNSTFFSPVQDDINDLPKNERIDQIKSSEFVGRNAPARNASRSDAGGMSFSTGHIFPAEKEAIAEKSFRPAPTKKASDDSNPFIINPSRGGEE